MRVVALERGEDAPSDRHALLEEMKRRAEGRAGRRGGIHVHDIVQATLVASRPWPVKFGAKDVATLVVAHLQSQLDDGKCEPLAKSWKVFQGIQTGADAYTRRIDKRLSGSDRAKLAAAGVVIGDAILELPPGAEVTKPWSDHPNVLARNPEPTGVLYAAIDESDYTSLVVLRDAPAPDVFAALEKFRPLLATRAEIMRNPRRRWWETAWPRNSTDMSSPKVIALYRTDRGRFALDEAGEWQPSIKSTLVVGRGKAAPVAYLCGVLNSELLDLWYAVRGKTPWHVRRNYEPKRMNEMPYRPTNGDLRTDEVAGLVREIAANRLALLPHREVVPKLVETVKDPWRTGPVTIDERALVGCLPVADTISLRLDPCLEFEEVDRAPAKVVRVDARSLELRRGRRAIGRIVGDRPRLDLLEHILDGKSDELVADTRLPKDAAAFAAQIEERRRVVQGLLDTGRELVERVERLICVIYDVPEDLTEQVVAHAVSRSTERL